MLNFDDSIRVSNEIIEAIMSEHCATEYNAFEFWGGRELMIEAGVCDEVIDMWNDAI